MREDDGQLTVMIMDTDCSSSWSLYILLYMEGSGIFYEILLDSPLFEFVPWRSERFYRLYSFVPQCSMKFSEVPCVIP
jgi:hypothetical protein